MPYVIKYFKNCNKFDDLQYILYTKKNKTLRSLPPTSNMSRGDDLRSYYVNLNCSNLILWYDNMILFDHELSLPIDSVWHCIRYGNIKVFSKPNFPVYGQNPRTYMRKYVSEKTYIFAYFTQCDLFHLLAQKCTHY